MDGEVKIIGDVHGKIGAYKLLVERAGREPTFQVGDMGLGFPGGCPPMMDLKDRFIRGNHDSPEECRKHPNYAGEFGYDPRYKLFFVGGAWSIDQHQRTEGKSWWRDEELSLRQLAEAMTLYEKVKPEIVISHDCPTDISQKILEKTYYVIGTGFVPLEKVKTRTDQALQVMFDIYKPRLWIFGHYHISFDQEFKGTRFVCLQELEHMDI